MSTAELLREELQEIITQAKNGDTDQVVRTAQTALDQLDKERSLTTSEAAKILGIGSVNTLKLLVRQHGIPYEQRGNRMILRLGDIEALQDSTVIRGIRASDRMHEATAALGTPNGLTAEQLEELEDTRPGRVPWEA